MSMSFKCSCMHSTHKIISYKELQFKPNSTVHIGWKLNPDVVIYILLIIGDKDLYGGFCNYTCHIL
jgi:hypothetical protein